MMANWDLSRMRRGPAESEAKSRADRRRQDDKAVQPGRRASSLAAVIPGAAVETIRRAGHLAHEEKPEEVGD